VANESGSPGLAPSVRPGDDGRGLVARLKVEIEEVEPAVIRRLEVPLDLRLDRLNVVLQVAIGWQNCHPFEFRHGDTVYGLVSSQNEVNPLPAEKATLADLTRLGSVFDYDYVFGDDWQHTLTIEDVAPAEPGVFYPRLLRAEGRCPPADIGGPEGYETFLIARANPEHLHHEGMLDWDDPDFDPHKVDIAALKSNLAKLSKFLRDKAKAAG
jgi:Plasmid pRiA4b ORF-3-like protein